MSKIYAKWHIQKQHAFTRLSHYIDHINSETYMNLFITVQLNYCLHERKFHDRTINSRLNNLQERALRLVCIDSEVELKKSLGKRCTYTSAQCANARD